MSNSKKPVNAFGPGNQPANNLNNAVLEGVDAVTQQTVPVSRIGNYTQNLQKVFAVSDMYLMIGAQNNGTYLTTSQGTWQNGNYVTCSGNVAWGLTAGAYISATLIQLEAGTVATPFERKTYNETLAQCQRYCYVINGASAIVGAGLVVATTVMDVAVAYPVTMRTNAVTLYTSNMQATTASYAGAGTAQSTGYAHANGIIYSITVAGASSAWAGNQAGFATVGGTGGYWAVETEL